MSENEEQQQVKPDCVDPKIATEAVREAKKNARENPSDKKTVENFQKMSTFPPMPARKRKKFARKTKSKNKTLIMKSNFYKGAFLEAYKNLAALGLNESTIERLFGIGSQYIAKTIGQDEDLQEADQLAMGELHNALARLMLTRAIGYDYTEEKTIYVRQGAYRKTAKADEKIASAIGENYPASKIKGKWIPYRKEVMERHHPGDTQLLIFFMTNRFPDKWKMSREILTGKAEGYDSKPGERNRKAIESIGRDVLEPSTDRPETEHSVPDGLARVSGGSDETSKK